nr:hypothetical protein CFP56_00468 [Quercus suber]
MLVTHLRTRKRPRIYVTVTKANDSFKLSLIHSDHHKPELFLNPRWPRLYIYLSDCTIANIFLEAGPPALVITIGVAQVQRLWTGNAFVIP